MAESLTDLVQALFMILALVVLPVIIILDAGGWNVIVEQHRTIDPTLADPYALTFGAAVGSLGIGLGSPGNPHILARYMSIDDPGQLRISAVDGTVWNVLMAWGALFIGLAGRTIIPDAAMLPASDTENLYPVLASMYLHPVLFGVMVASIFAAIMSTANSQLLVAA
jgi:Na+/proline symporter